MCVCVHVCVADVPDTTDSPPSSATPSQVTASDPNQQTRGSDRGQDMPLVEVEEQDGGGMSWLEASDGEEVKEVILTEETVDTVEMYVVGEGSQEAETVQGTVSITIKEDS